jgi:hypothetical protein
MGMRKTPYFLSWLAWASVGTAGLTACSLDLGYLQAGGGPDAGPDVKHPDPDAGGGSDGGAALDASDDITVADGSTDDAADAAPTADASMDAADANPAPNLPGCAAVIVPFSTSNQVTDFTINLATTYDFSAATISAWLYAPNATDGFVDPYIQNNGGTYPREQLGPQPLSSLGSWTMLSWPIPATSSVGFDPTATYYFGLTMESGTKTTAYEQPNTVLYVGEIIVTGAMPAIPAYFYANAASVSGTTPPMLPSGVLWLNTYDSPLAGANLVWDPSCGKSSLDAGSPDAAAGEDASVDASIADGGGG